MEFHLICNNCGGRYQTIDTNSPDDTMRLPDHESKGIGAKNKIEKKSYRYQCPVCGAVKPKVSYDEENALTYRAFQLLAEAKFEEANEAFDVVLEQYPNNIEAYWGKVKSKYRVIYKQNPKGKMHPTCEKTFYGSVLKDEYYQKAFLYADDRIRKFLKKQANEIDRIRGLKVKQTVVIALISSLILGLGSFHAYQFFSHEHTLATDSNIAQTCAAKGHTPGAEATCTTTQNCNECNAILAAAKGHTPGAEATCTTTQNCSECNVVLAAAKGHTLSAEATCTTTQNCTVCQAVLVTANGHIPGAEATCTESQKCMVCQKEVSPALGHTLGSGATCTNPQNCTVCQETVSPALGHTPGEAATCTTAQYCTVCRVQLMGVQPHIYNREIAIAAALKSPATTSSAAIYYKSCVCGAISTKATDTFTSGSPIEETMLPPVFARFDFGTATKAEELGLTSHDYLVENLTYDESFISVSYTEDSIIVTAVQDHPEITFDNSEEGNGAEIFNGYSVTSYALCFEDLINYDFDDCLTKEKNFMRIRIKNNTTNNIIAIRWHKPGQVYATTLLASCMYLQGGAPTVDDYVNGETKKTCEASDVYKTYTYDINFLASLARYGDRKETQANSYVHMAYYVGLGGSTGANNWNWLGVEEVAALQFFVLGAYGGRPTAGRLHYGYADTRANIVAGATVEIDYITFGAKADLNSFTSNIEDESVSRSEAAAATATSANW